MKRIMIALALVAAAAMAFGQGTIKIGATWPLADITGKQGSMAAQQAVDEINKAGGILGRQLELIVIDDELKADKGAAAIEKLVTVDNVDVLMGGMASGVALGQIPAMKKYGKVVMSTGAASLQGRRGPRRRRQLVLPPAPLGLQPGQRPTPRAGTRSRRSTRPSRSRRFSWPTRKAPSARRPSTRPRCCSEPAAATSIDGASFKSAALGGGDYGSMLEAAKMFKPDLFLWAGYDADALPMLEQAKAMKFNPGIYLGAPPGWPIGFGTSTLSEQRDALRHVGPVDQRHQPDQQEVL